MDDPYFQLQQLAAARQSTRTYSDKPVAQEDIDKIIAIAQTSPYASRKKNWKIHTITSDETKKQLVEAVKDQVQTYSKKMRDDYRAGFLEYAQNFDFFRSAPVLLIPDFRVVKPVSMMLDATVPEIEQWERDTYVKSISSVITMILLAAQSLDLGACYMTGPLIAESKIKQILNIKPNNSIGAIIPIGYGDNKS